MPSFPDELMNAIIMVAREAGEMAKIMRHEPQALGVGLKPDNSVVTEADRRLEKLIRERLVPRYGGAFLGEESGKSADMTDSNQEWLVDPIDGTTNYAAGTIGGGCYPSDPNWSVSIALKEHGTVTRGVVYCPDSNQLYWAHTTNGAYVIDDKGTEKKLQLPKAIPPKTSMELGAFLGANAEALRVALSDTYRQHTGGSHRNLGSVAMGIIQVATCSRGAFAQGNVNEYDVAAAALIAREAGAHIAFDPLENDPKGRMATIIAHPSVHGYLVSLYNYRTGNHMVSIPFAEAD